jgi:hypothetical protein
MTADTVLGKRSVDKHTYDMVIPIDRISRLHCGREN